MHASQSLLLPQGEQVPSALQQSLGLGHSFSVSHGCCWVLSLQIPVAVSHSLPAGQVTPWQRGIQLPCGSHFCVGGQLQLMTSGLFGSGVTEPSGTVSGGDTGLSGAASGTLCSLGGGGGTNSFTQHLLAPQSSPSLQSATLRQGLQVGSLGTHFFLSISQRSLAPHFSGQMGAGAGRPQLIPRPSTAINALMTTNRFHCNMCTTALLHIFHRPKNDPGIPLRL